LLVLPNTVKRIDWNKQSLSEKYISKRVSSLSPIDFIRCLRDLVSGRNLVDEAEEAKITIRAVHNDWWSLGTAKVVLEFVDGVDNDDGQIEDTEPGSKRDSKRFPKRNKKSFPKDDDAESWNILAIVREAIPKTELEHIELWNSDPAPDQRTTMDIDGRSEIQAFWRDQAVDDGMFTRDLASSYLEYRLKSPATIRVSLSPRSILDVLAIRKVKGRSFANWT